jgi:5,10-methylene-tetrahydrofolate dehydrogenase/methenyl tetrahydrofolate cyclohydrolase
MRLFDAYGADPAGQHAVVLGRSPILGKPVGVLLLRSDATVTYCHSKTRDLAEVVRAADIVVAAIGRPQFVRGDWIKPGAVVVDAGYNTGNIGGDAAPDGSGEPLAFVLRPGNAGSNTATDHIEAPHHGCPEFSAPQRHVATVFNVSNSVPGKPLAPQLAPEPTNEKYL